MKNKKIRWGIIGLGRIAEKFATDLASIKNTTLVAVASKSINKAEIFAKKYNVPHFFNSYEALFEIPVDAIYIATTHTFHLEATLLCLKNKVAVLCEKPLAINEAQVQLMIKTARENNTFLMEAMWTRFIPAIEKALALVKIGKIGTVREIRADFGFFASFDAERRIFKQELGGGALLDIGIYPVFLSLLFLGYPSKVEAISNFNSQKTDSATHIILAYRNDALASLSCSFCTNTKTEAFIYGENGYIHLENRFIDTRKITLFENGQKPVVYRFSRKTLGYNFEIEEVNECLRNGEKESKKLPLSMSLDLIKLLDKIREKAGIVYKHID